MNATSKEVLAGVTEAIKRANPLGQPVPALDPGHRHAFHWPPHAISRDYHVTSSDWRESSSHIFRGEEYEVQWAETEQGLFGRIINLWNEARGSSLDEVLAELESGAAPWFERMDSISRAIGLENRFHGQISELSNPQLAALLFADDRDVAYTAVIEIEKRASRVQFAEAFVTILSDNLHPNRRTAQWCVLDMLEDYKAFCRSEAEVQAVVTAVHNLMAHAPDDFARTIYKAGVVLGGHFCNEPAAEALIACLTSPSKIGRRSAMHAVFHLVEWLPDHRSQVVRALRESAETESEPLLREFALSQASDIESGAHDHKSEPIFPEEIPA
ncbi:hypothetical protein C0431_06330 [bacterium]|nr:hypothetical protein [bacterium]